MSAEKQMQLVGEVNGQKIYWAEPGQFEKPGLYRWDGVRNVQIALPWPTSNRAVVQWDLYKESGKWAYGGKATFDVPKGFIDDAQLLKLVATAPDQNQVHPNTILDRHYMVVIKETEETMDSPTYVGFLCRVIHQKGSVL